MRIITTMASAALAVALIGSLAGCDRFPASVASTHEPYPSDTTTTSATFVRVIDGDTIAVRPAGDLPDTGYGEHSVRLLGIDAPEMHKMSDQDPDCGAEAATEHLEALLAGATTVTLAFDAISDHTDRFGRSLAYVEVGGHDLNLEQAAGGYAEAWYPRSEPAPTRYGSYRSAEEAAAQAGSGSWGVCGTLGR